MYYCLSVLAATWPVLFRLFKSFLGMSFPTTDLAKSLDPDQTPQNASSDQGLRCF